MKIIHLAPALKSFASAAWRIVIAQNKYNINAIPMVYVSKLKYKSIIIYSNILVKIYKLLITRAINFLLKKLSFGRKKFPWTYSYTLNYISRVLCLDVDKINIHWLPAFVNLDDLKYIRVPIYLTLHDVWPLTGGCHCNFECSNWLEGCTNCPQSGKILGVKSLAEKEWKYKKKSFSQIEDLKLICPSKWIANMAKKSQFFEGRDIFVIPNTLDQSIFLKKNKEKSRNKFKLPLDKKIIMFCVAGNINDFHKGFDLLIKALYKIKRDDIHLLVIGNSSSININDINYTHINTISEQEELSDAYNCADVFVNASRQDNLPNTLLEASCCAVPCVGFDIGGISEIILHKKSGYIVKPFDVLSLSDGIMWILDNEFQINDDILSQIRNKFSEKKIAEQYQNAYLSKTRSKG